MSDLHTFEAHRTHLLNLAYRMLGEMAAAEDVVQEAWVRWHGANASDIRNPRAWLSAVTVRLALDALRKLRARRETYVGPWLPEPILPDDIRAFAADRPAEKAELASDLSLALLHVLERLAPEERAAFILHDAFDCDYAEIASVLGKSEVACRQLVSRARERVKAGRPRFAASKEAHRDLLLRFAQAVASPDLRDVTALLAPNAVAYSDGGGRVPAALKPIYGAEKIGRFVMGLRRKFYANAAIDVQMVEVNGEPGLELSVDETFLGIVTIESDSQQITGVYILRNPDKLARFRRVAGVASGASVAR
jgi:RNA polymerase sigma-70 factor (ECF subfamily)